MFKKLQKTKPLKRFIIFIAGFILVLTVFQIMVTAAFFVVFPNPSKTLLLGLENSFSDFLKYVTYIYFIAALVVNFKIEKRNFEETK